MDLCLAVLTPQVRAWGSALAKHPDRDFASYVVSGLKYGFHIGVEQGRVLQGAKANMKSDKKNPSVVSEYIQKEVSAGNILGLFLPGALESNRFGSIPKNINLVNGV